MSQNCKECEYDHSNMGDGNGGHCYMFKDKPKGRCSQFSQVLSRLGKQTKQILGNWANFIK